MDFTQLIPTPQPITLSLGLELLIQQKVQEKQGALELADLAECSARLYPEKVVKEHINSLAQQFIERVERLSGMTADAQDANDKPHLGQHLQEWVNQLTPTGVCLYLADYDPEKAYHLFWWVAASLVEESLKHKLHLELVKHINRYEATVYGFGGGFGGSTEVQEETIPDMNSPEGKLGLASLGLNF